MPSGDADFNPGNDDPDVGGAIADDLGRAVRAAPTGSPAHIELERRYDYLWGGVGRMVRDGIDDWWDGPKTDDATLA